MNREQFIDNVRIEQNALRGFLLALCCGDEAEADDILQESLMKAYLHLDRYSDRGKFHSWLFRIAHNTFLNRIASARPCSSIDEFQSIPDKTSADSGYKYQELYMALTYLPPSERVSVTLFYLNGYSVKEISKCTGNSVNAVKKQLSRGREKLRKHITGYDK
ncbi:MAG: RNA polymerase sigma factor [Bacteroidales bacterium]|nr:RNA polymerase sigma factor [Bacteroidales bacterium]